MSTDTPSKPWWESADWSKPRSTIAAEAGVSSSAVTRRARKLGFDVKVAPSHRSFDRSSIDWSKTIKELVAETGISRDTLYNWRIQYLAAGGEIQYSRRKCPWTALTGANRKDMVRMFREIPVGSVVWLPLSQNDAAGIQSQLPDRKLQVHQFRATPMRETHGEFDIVRITVLPK